MEDNDCVLRKSIWLEFQLMAKGRKALTQHDLLFPRSTFSLFQLDHHVQNNNKHVLNKVNMFLSGFYIPTFLPYIVLFYHLTQEGDLTQTCKLNLSRQTRPVAYKSGALKAIACFRIPTYVRFISLLSCWLCCNTPHQISLCFPP